jgi:ADP-heptose:LPS heptosyltransferase
MRIAVFRALQLGDLLCAIPALRSLRAGFGDAKITLVGLPWAAELVRRFPAYLDGFVPFPGWPGLPERDPVLEEIPAFLARMQALELDLAVQLHGSGDVTNPLVALFGARETAGFRRLDGPPLLSGRFLAWPERGSEIHRLLALTDFLGCPPCGDELEFPVWADDEAELDSLAPDEGDYACVHPGARLETRRWSPERFADVADALAADGLRVVLTGSAAETRLTAHVAAAMRAPALDLAGKTSVGGLAALLARARVLVCNDTGVSHLAAALRVPSVVVVTTSDPERWAPLDRELHRVVVRPRGVEDVLAAIPAARA